MPISTYSPGNKFAPTFTNSVGEQTSKERADRIEKYGNQKTNLETRLQNMLDKSTCKGVEPKDFFKSDNSIKSKYKLLVRDDNGNFIPEPDNPFSDNPYYRLIK